MGKLEKMLSWVLAFCCSTLTVAFDCPAECSCMSGTGLSITCHGFQRGSTIPAGFVTNVNRVSGISIHSTNVAISENAFANFSCVGDGTIQFPSSAIFEIQEGAFHHIDGCKFSIPQIGRIPRNAFYHLRNVKGFSFSGIGIVSPEAFNDIIGAGTCTDASIGRINKLERHGFSNIMNFRTIQFGSINNMDSYSMFNVSYVQTVRFRSVTIGKAYPHAFGGLHCCASFEMYGSSISVTSNNAFSGMRNIRKMIFSGSSLRNIGSDIFSDIEGVVHFDRLYLRTVQTLRQESFVNLTDDHPCLFLRPEYPQCEYPLDFFSINDTTQSQPQCFPTEPCKQVCPTTTVTWPPYLTPKCPTSPPAVTSKCPSPAPTVTPKCPTPPRIVTRKCPTPPPAVTSRDNMTFIQLPITPDLGVTTAPSTGQSGTIVLLLAVLVAIIVCLVACVITMTCVVFNMKRSTTSGGELKNDRRSDASPPRDRGPAEYAAICSFQGDTTDPFTEL